MNTIKCKLVAEDVDIFDYRTYVFKNLEPNPPFGRSYIMCVRFPNWNHKNLEPNEEGYLTYKEVVAGKDGWYDQTSGKIIPYNYSNLIFIKFVKKIDNFNKDIII